MSLPFALNHIASPRRDVAACFALAKELGIADVEIRNDLPGVATQDGTPAATVRDAAAAAGVGILSINALQRFNQWNPTRAAEAEALAVYAAGCGARAVVMCPVNSTADVRGDGQRGDDLREALAALRPILAAHGVVGLVEPLGFAESSLRLKRVAVEAIDAVGGGEVFRVLHDTFHHFLSGEAELFPARTGLVHISGVDDPTLPRDRIRDSNRVLVGPADVTGNVGQIAALRRGGYSGPFSFEPFSRAVHDLPDIAAALRASMAAVEAGVAAAAA